MNQTLKICLVLKEVGIFSSQEGVGNKRVLCPVVKCIINAIIRDESHKDFC